MMWLDFDQPAMMRLQFDHSRLDMAHHVKIPHLGPWRIKRIHSIIFNNFAISFSLNDIGSALLTPDQSENISHKW
jgi:hypothetical protein